MRKIGMVVLLFCSHFLTAQIVNIEDMRITGTSDSIRWYGSTQAAFTLTKVQEQTTVFQADSRLQYKYHRNVVLLLLNANFLRAGTQNFVNTAFMHLRYNYKINPVLSWELYGQQQSNQLQLMKSRTLLGTGLRRRFFLNKSKTSRMYLGMAYLFEKNIFTESYGKRDWHRMSNYLSISLRAPKSSVILRGTTYWQPAIGYIKNVRYSTEWTLELPITEHLRFTTNITYSVDRGLPQAAPLKAYNWVNGLVWQW